MGLLVYDQKIKRGRTIMTVKTSYLVSNGIYFDVLNWPIDYSSLIFFHIKQHASMNNFIGIYFEHVNNKTKHTGAIPFQLFSALSFENFDKSFRDIFSKINNLCGKLLVKTVIVKQECKYCNLCIKKRK